MRRGKALWTGVTLAAGIALLTTAVAGQRGPQQLSVTVSQIKPNIYWAAGGGGNSGIIIGDNGVIVIDPKTTAEGAKLLLAEIAKITPKPVTHFFSTHSDADHWGGADAFPASAMWITSEGFRKELLAIEKMGDAPHKRVPSRLVKRGKESVTYNGVRLDLYHWVPGHTSGDLVIHVPEERLVFTGDVTSNARPEPTLHAHKGANPDGWIAIVNNILKLNGELYVSGHGTMENFTPAWLQTRVKEATETNNRVKAMVAEGRSLGDIKMTLKMAPGPASGNPTYLEVAYWNALLKR